MIKGDILMDKKIIYVDNASTTAIDHQVLNEMIPYLKEEYGNASSIYRTSVETLEKL